MACQDCFKNCGNSYTSDKCVEYTGPDNEVLGICTGDTLSQVEAQIIQHLIDVLDGTGIVIDDVTLEDCPWLRDQFVGKDKTLVNLFQLLIDNQCSLKETLDSFSGETQPFDTKCLTGLPDNPTSVDILQAVVTQSCALKTTVDAIPTTYVKLSDLETLVEQIINQNTTVTTSPFPKYIPVPYIGPMSNFDNTGRGTGDYAGWFVMNGQNGTQDWRGRKVVGAIRNVPGGALDADVDPTNWGSGVNYGIGDKFGKPFHQLTIDEIPAHTHSAVDSGHKHSMTGSAKQSFGGGGWPLAGTANAIGGTVTESAGSTNNASANITIGSTGNGLRHENRDPSVSAVWIVKL